MTKYTRNASASRIALPSARRDRQLALVLATLALLLAAVWAVWPLRDRIEQQKEINSLLNDRRRARQENVRLRKDIDNLRQNPEYIEWTARKDLGLIKADEEAYVIIERPAGRK